MPSPSAAVVVTFSTIDRAFLDTILSESLRFAKQVVVSYGTQLLNGEPEDLDWIAQKKVEWNEKDPRVTFASYDVVLPIENNPLKYRQHAYYHNVSRIRGVECIREVNPNVDCVFFLDSDEVPDGMLVLNWLSNVQLPENKAILFANYWYFRDPRFQATTLESSILMVPWDWVSTDEKADRLLMQDMERHAMPREATIVGVVMPNNLAMFHHYSWVRSKADLLRKVTCWGHKGDRDWISEVEREFEGEFQGRDFVHGYEYKIVPNRWKINVN